MSIVFYEARQARRKKLGETWEKESDIFPIQRPKQQQNTHSRNHVIEKGVDTSH